MWFSALEAPVQCTATSLSAKLSNRLRLVEEVEVEVAVVVVVLVGVVV